MRNRSDRPVALWKPTAAALSGLLLLSACGAPPAPSGDGADRGEAAGATSAADLGGLEGLIEAAQEEGELNVIALPPDWANYGEMISTFEEKYDITVNSAASDATSQEEINAAEQNAGTDRAPDVFDLGQAVALANADKHFAPYQVETWDDIDDSIKHPEGKYVGDYTGFMSVGYNADEVPAPTSLDDLLGEEYRGKVALNGDPTQAGAAFSGVVMAALGNGGSVDDIAPGVEFFAELKEAGNFLPVDPTPATIASGETPVVIDWDYTNAQQTLDLEGQVDWQVFVPEDAVVSSYYYQAVNLDAPHPAAARLWQEFVFSDEGQNIYLNGFARPARAEAMESAGTIDTDAFGRLPASDGEPVSLTQEQSDAAAEYLTQNWADAVA
ncbi:ABC transporter substrate-binding protein [Nocardiopsis ansamitocini]|uniref:ABC transporter substrate-binding protein n=1 Tax=Nocardiopsis ansamitocini TaxID=1670832 RepID=A0A9W6UFS4_9ACTN|nr:ABC transporter substrate-binding protein [Nocardiopsis ansamitocini]GLU45751.1 ABC transporter substrate-binding protein [Nocardiopsis ansamitocini]